MSAQDTMGKLVDESERRDAVHIAMAPVVAGERIQPGEDIGFIESNTSVVGQCENPIGIADPFLKSFVKKGQRFWMFLYPNTISSLRHEWEHPAFGAVVAQAPANGERKATAIGAIGKFAGRIGEDYDCIMASAKRWLDGEEVWSSSTYYDECSTDDWDEFWRNYEIVTGVKPPADKAHRMYFSCSC